MRHKLFVQPEKYQQQELACPGVGIRCYLDSLTKLLGIWDISPIHIQNETSFSSIAMSLAIGVAINVLRSCPEMRELEIIYEGEADPGWEKITCIFNGLSNQKLELSADFNEKIPKGPNCGMVVLASGGKDTLYVLENLKRANTLSPGTTAIYLGEGAELNWREEIRQVVTVTDYFSLNLQAFRLGQMMISSKGVLRFGNRGAWRELITLSIARTFGNSIYTGINNDSIARLEKFNPGNEDFLSQLIPTLDALESILEADIHTAPGEFQVYQQIRNHHLFDKKGSCLRPDCGGLLLCAKHKTFDVYDRLLEGLPLRSEDYGFVHGPHYLGDATVLDLTSHSMEVIR